MRPPIRLLAAVFLLGALVATPSTGAADPDTPPRLELAQLFGGKRFTRSLPSWSWRPGQDELVRFDQRVLPDVDPKKKRRVLVGRHPEHGTERILLDVVSLDALVEKAGPKPGRIGRAGAPTHVWQKDGNAIVVVVKGQLVYVDLTSDTREVITSTRKSMSDFRLSPDGSMVSFSRTNDLWLVPTAGGKLVRLTKGGTETVRNGTLDWVYPEEFGYSTAAWWAPDSTHVAYLQLDQTEVPQHRLPKMLGLRGEGRVMRYPRAGDPNPKARVGIVKATGGATTWLDLDNPEYVARVVWTPDAKRVLVVTLDRKQQHLQVRSCDPETGASVVLFEEQDDAWISIPRRPRFEKGGLVWRTHRDGAYRFEHIRLDETGTKVASRAWLTPAGHDANALLHLDDDGKAIYRATRHGANVTNIRTTGEDGVPEAPPFLPEPDMSSSATISPSGRFAVVTYSDTLTPPRRELWKTDGELLASLGDARTDRFDALGLAEPEEITLPIPEGKIRMRLWKPSEFDIQQEEHSGTTYPVIIQTYGGPGSRTVRSNFGRGPLFATLLTERGFLVLQIDGRGTGGQGAAFERTVRGQLGVHEIADQVRGLAHVASTRPYIDTSRVGIWGWSYGGTMACNAMTMHPETFHAAVAVAPVTDWRLYDTIYTERYMDTPQANEAGYKRSSSVTFAKDFRGRLLLLHGLGDDNVHVQNTYRLAEALLKAKKPGVDVMTYPWRGHGIQGVTLDVYRRLVAHFERALRPSPPLPR